MRSVFHYKYRILNFQPFRFSEPHRTQFFRMVGECSSFPPQQVRLSPIIVRIPKPNLKIRIRAIFLDSASRFGFGICKYQDSDSRFEIRDIASILRFGVEIRIRFPSILDSDSRFGRILRIYKS